MPWIAKPSRRAEVNPSADGAPPRSGATPRRRDLLLLAAALFALPGVARGSNETTVVVSVQDEQVVLRTRDADFRTQASARVLGQLRSLDGATIRVPGRPCGASLRVRRFAILLAPDGLVPHVGTVLVDQSGTYLEPEGGARIVLLGEAAPTAAHHRRWCWVTGIVSGPQRLVVLRFGVMEAAASAR